MVEDVAVRAGFKQWAGWVLFGSVGWIAGFLLAFGAMRMAGEAAYGQPDLAYVSDLAYASTLTFAFVLAAIGLGTGQVLSMHRALRIDAGWAVAYVAGAILLGLTAAALADASSLALKLLPYAVGGLVAGLIQALQLRGLVRNAWMWFAVQALVFLGAGAFEIALAASMGLNGTWALAIGMAVAGMVTGLVAVMLARTRNGVRAPSGIAWIRPAPADVPSLRGPPPTR